MATTEHLRTTHVYEAATSVNQVKTIREKVTFENYNPNGLMARKKRNDRVIDQLIAEGKVPSGWVWVYGGLSNSRYWLYDLLKKSRISGREYRIQTAMLLNDIEYAESAIAEVTEA